MRIGEVLGGLALVGTAILIGLTLRDDREPDTLTTDTSPFVFDEATTTAAPPSTTAAPASTASPETTTAATTTPPTTPPPSTAATTTTEPLPPASTAPATTIAPTTTLIPREARGTIGLRVLNGGAPPMSATIVSDALREAGFDPLPAIDASTLVGATTVLYAQGGELAALTVNEVVGAEPASLVAAGEDDPNWTQHGEGLTVLVVLGPRPA